MQNKVKTSKEHYERFAKLLEENPSAIKIAKDILESSVMYWDLEKIKERIIEDEENRHLNFIRLPTWDNGTMSLFNLRWPLSEKVCLLKHAALYWVLWFEPVFTTGYSIKTSSWRNMYIEALTEEEAEKKAKKLLENAVIIAITCNKEL